MLFESLSDYLYIVRYLDARVASDDDSEHESYYEFVDADFRLDEVIRHSVTGQLVVAETIDLKLIKDFVRAIDELPIENMFGQPEPSVFLLNLLLYLGQDLNLA